MTAGRVPAALEEAERIMDPYAPLVGQIKKLNRAQYIPWVHKPFHYVGTQKEARLFGPDALEFFTHTEWWVIPLIWVPVSLYLWHWFVLDPSSTVLGGLAVFTCGITLWSVLEYVVHRFVFHLDDWVPDNGVCLTLHFLLHGVHHFSPMDRYRLVMPPVLFAALSITISSALRVTLFSWLPFHIFTAIVGSVILGYVAYDMVHYSQHHMKLNPKSYWGHMKKLHMRHHWHGMYNNGYGITTTLWDKVFGTEIPVDEAVIRKAQQETNIDALSKAE